MSLTLYALSGAGIALAVWYAIVVGFALATRPRSLRPGPAVMELGAEPPAVVNLLVTRCRPGVAAADATLLDLAARRILELQQPGDDPGELLVRVRVGQPAGLAPYEQRVFDRVAAVAGERFTPLRQVLDGYAAGGPHWFAHLRAEVIADAQRRGLVLGRRLGTPIVLLCLLTGMGIACLGILPLQHPGQGAGGTAIGFATVLGWFCAAPVLALVLLSIALVHLSGPRYTPQGRAAGEYWLGVAAWLAAHPGTADLPPAAVAVWDRYLAYGVALGSNRLAARVLDLRTGRYAAFTSYLSGQPRTVHVRYPRSPFAYTQAGVRAGVNAVLLAGAVAGWPALLAASAHWPPAAGVGARVVLAAIGARAGYVMLRCLHAKLTPIRVGGRILALHPWRPRTDGASGWIELVVDDGRHDRTRPWLIRLDRATGLRAGDHVRLRGQRFTRYVLNLAVTPPPSGQR